MLSSISLKFQSVSLFLRFVFVCVWQGAVCDDSGYVVRAIFTAALLVTASATEIDLHALAAGVYVLELRSGNAVRREKVIVVR